MMGMTAEDFLKELYESCDSIVAYLNIIDSDFAGFKAMPLIQNAIIYNVINIHEIICNIVSYKDDIGNKDIHDLYNSIEHRYNTMKFDLQNCRNKSAHNDTEDISLETVWNLCIDDITKLQQELKLQYIRKVKSTKRKLLYPKKDLYEI